MRGSWANALGVPEHIWLAGTTQPASCHFSRRGGSIPASEGRPWGAWEQQRLQAGSKAEPD